MNRSSPDPWAPTREFFDRAAPTWDEKMSLDSALAAAILDRAGLPAKGAQPAASAPGPGRLRVLDVGSGTGLLIPFILERVLPGGKVYALDLSPLMLDQLRAKGLPNVETLCAPVEAIPLPDASCDVVICFSAFPHFADQGRALAEMARVLVSGGRLVIAHGRPRQAINDFHTNLGGAVADHHLPDRTTMLRLLARAGLTTLELTDGPQGYFVVAVR